MKDKLFKKRPHINWDYVRLEICDRDVDAYFFELRTRNRFLSINRAAYLSLRHFYSKATLDYFRRTKDFEIFGILDFHWPIWKQL